jgi:uncharacterized protein HemY
MLTKSLEIDPNSPITHYHIGMLYFKQKDFAKAELHLQKALDSKVNFDGMEQAKETLEKAKQGG